MTIAKFRSTDYGGRHEPLHIATSAEEARRAALDSVTTHCLDCGDSFVGHVIPGHDCRNPAAGKDNTAMKLARAAGARREASRC